MEQQSIIHRLTQLSWDAFELLSRLYGLRNQGSIADSFDVIHYLFDDQKYLWINGKRIITVSALMLKELFDHDLISTQVSAQERLRTTLYANNRARYHFSYTKELEHFFSTAPIVQLAELLNIILEPIIEKDIGIEALCASLQVIENERLTVQRHRVASMLSGCLRYFSHDPEAVGKALLFIGGFSLHMLGE